MLALDHIVITDKNIELASKQFSEDFSIESVKGGMHPAWGTYNHLAYLSNASYIEWLGLNDEEIARASNNPLIQHLLYVLSMKKSGPFQFALRTNELDSFVAHFNKQNIPFVGPVEGRRTTPSGDKLQWRMLFPKYDVTETMLPFLIEWEKPATYHPINQKKIKALHYSGLEMDEFCHIYQIKRSNTLNKQINLENSHLQFLNDRQQLFNYTF